MTNELAPGDSFFTPTRVVTALAVGVVLLSGGVLLIWMTAPRTVTLEVSEPAGRTVLCHIVVDGRAEAHEDMVPVDYHFDARELRYAVICLDADRPADVTVTLRDRTGTAGAITAAGVTGVYESNWWGSRSRIEPMTPTHVRTMRRSAEAALEETLSSYEDISSGRALQVF